MRERILKSACQNFLYALGDHVTDGDVFVVLAEIAESQGLQLQAHQRGINSTYIVLVEQPK